MVQFDGESNSQDIASAIDFYCSTSDTDYPVVDKVRNANFALHEAHNIIAQATRTWRHDDANYTTLPFFTTNLVANQRDYTIDTSIIKLDRVEIKDTNGNWIELKPTTDIPSPFNGYKATAGTPAEYFKIGGSIYLFPGSSYNSTNGLRMQGPRIASVFAYNSTTKEPGFNVAFHEYIVVGAALRYCAIFKPDRVPMLTTLRNEQKEAMAAFYGSRGNDEPSRMTPNVENNK